MIFSDYASIFISHYPYQSRTHALKHAHENTHAPQKRMHMHAHAGTYMIFFLEELVPVEYSNDGLKWKLFESVANLQSFAVAKFPGYAATKGT